MWASGDFCELGTSASKFRPDVSSLGESWASCRWSGPSWNRRCAVSPSTGVHLVRAGQELARVRLKPRLTFAAAERSWAHFPPTDASVPTRSSHSSTTSSHLRTSGAKLLTTARVWAECVVDFGASGLVRQTSCARCPKTAPALERSGALDRRTAPHLETSQTARIMTRRSCRRSRSKRGSASSA